MLTRPFGAEERPFVLRGRGWRELEKARDCGLGVIAARLAPLVSLMSAGAAAWPGGLMGAIAAGQLGPARLDDVREPILQGLIDGGMTSTEAGALVRKVFDEAIEAGRGPLLTFAPLAFEIVSGALIGLEDEPVLGETTAAAPKPAKARRRSPTARPASSSSTAPSP